MGIFSRFKKVAEEVGDIPVSMWKAGFAGPAFGGGETALENSTFWACVTKLCRTFGSLPLHIFETDGNRREILRTGAGARLLSDPCPYMTPYQWRFIMAFNYELYGVAYAVLKRSSMGDPIEAYPISPNAIHPLWKDGKLFYSIPATGEVFPASEVLVIYNTPTGYSSVLSPVEYAGKDLSVASNAKTLQDAYYKRGTTIGGTVTVPRGTPKEVKDAIKAMFAGEFSGMSGAYRVAVLEDIIKYEPIRLTEDDSKKMSEAQSWTLLEVCRRFGVPPAFAGDLTKSTYANQEQQAIELVTYSIQPRAKSWEDALDKVVCKDGQYIKFSLAGLMRGDHSTRSAFYHAGILDGWLTPNEARAYEDLNPVPEGDHLMFPLNYMSLADVVNGAGAPGLPVIPSYGEDVKHAAAQPGSLTEKRNEDLSFLSEAQAVTRSVRSQIETVIRKQLKAEIDEIKRLIATNQGQGVQKILDDFKAFCEKTAGEYGQQYVPIYQGIINRLVPIVQKQVKTGSEISQESLDNYASKYAVSMAGRHGNARSSDASRILAGRQEDELSTLADEMASGWLDTIPKTESFDETNRAGNAFNLFTFGMLGVSYMHVVASADACEFCRGLDGKVVEVNGAVLDKGTAVDDGAGNVRIINKTMKHPPFHTHCECGIAPGK